MRAPSPLVTPSPPVRGRGCARVRAPVFARACVRTCAVTRASACAVSRVGVRAVSRARACAKEREWVGAEIGAIVCAEVGARVSARCAFVRFVSLFVSLLCVACVECSTWNNC